MNKTNVNPTFQTERLTLRPLTEEDAPAFFDIFRDPETMRFMPSLPHQSVEETRAHLARELGMSGAVLWAICLRGTNEVIGHVHYLGQTRLPGMGYIVRRDHWGKGIAPEACRAALSYGFEQLGYDRIELWIDETNHASQRVAQKLEFRLKARIPQKYAHETEQHIMLIYGLWAHEWSGQNKDELSRHTRFFNVQPVLIVADVPATVAFYRDSLGFTVDFLYGDPPNHAGVSRGDWTGGMAVLQLSDGAPEGKVTPSSYLYFMVDSTIDTLFETYKSRDIEIVEALASRPWGMREFTIRDLNGHILRFGTHV